MLLAGLSRELGTHVALTRAPPARGLLLIKPPADKQTRGDEGSGPATRQGPEGSPTSSALPALPCL